MHIIGINGPAKVGKSFFAKQVLEMVYGGAAYMGWDPTGIVIDRHIESLRHMLFAFADTFHAQLIERNDDNYAKLKELDMHGRTGREWQIVWGTAMRAVDQNIFSKDLLNRLIARKTTVALVDDFGFIDEVTFMENLPAEHTFELIYLGERNPRKYKHLDQFDGDSRMCMVDKAEHVDPNPRTIAHYIAERVTLGLAPPAETPLI